MDELYGWTCVNEWLDFMDLPKRFSWEWMNWN